MPTIAQIPGMGGGMGGMGGGMSCENPNCTNCGGGMGGAQCSCGDPNCPIGRQSFIPGCPCADCQRQDMGGEGGLMPPITDPTSCGDPNCPDCGDGEMGGGGGGGMPSTPTWPGGEGSEGGMQPGGQAPPPTGPDINMTPKLRCLGTTGQEIDCTIDTGMQSNGQVTPSAYRKHLQGLRLIRACPTLCGA